MLVWSLLHLLAYASSTDSSGVLGVRSAAAHPSVHITRFFRLLGHTTHQILYLSDIWSIAQQIIYEGIPGLLTNLNGTMLGIRIKESPFRLQKELKPFIPIQTKYAIQKQVSFIADLLLFCDLI